MIDIHCHILPGLDDGAKTLEDALEMAKIALGDGVEKIVATPHLFRNDIIHKEFGLIEEKKQEFVEALSRNNIQLDLFTGAEVHISHNLIDAIRKNKND